jgi:tetratricopeptide (TPR) repeat protein
MNSLRIVTMICACAFAAVAWTMPAAAAEPVKEPAKSETAKAPPLSPLEIEWMEAATRFREAAQKNDLPVAEKFCVDVIKIAEGFGPKDDRLLAAVLTLVRVRVMQGKFAEAVEPAKRVVDIREKTTGADSLQTAGALNDLAGLLKDQKKLEESEPIYKRSLAIAEKSGGPGEGLVAVLQSNLAELYRDQGKLPEAEKAAKQAVAIREKNATVQGPQAVPVLHVLGDIYAAEGKLAEAEATHKRAIEIIRQAMGSMNRPVVMESINHLADTYKTAGKFTEAETTYKESLKVAEGLGPNDVYAATLEKYADLLHKMKRDSEADILAAQAKDMRSKLEAARSGGPR